MTLVSLKTQMTTCNMKSKASHPVVVHGVGPPFGGRGAFKVLQLLQQLLAEGPGEHRQAEDAGSFSGEHRQTVGLWALVTSFHIQAGKSASMSFSNSPASDCSIPSSPS